MCYIKCLLVELALPKNYVLPENYLFLPCPSAVTGKFFGKTIKKRILMTGSLCGGLRVFKTPFLVHLTFVDGIESLKNIFGGKAGVG